METKVCTLVNIKGQNKTVIGKASLHYRVSRCGGRGQAGWLALDMALGINGACAYKFLYWGPPLMTTGIFTNTGADPAL